MKQLNKNRQIKETTGLTTPLSSLQTVQEETSFDLAELIRSGKVTREELGAAIDMMDQEQRRQEILPDVPGISDSGRQYSMKIFVYQLSDSVQPPTLS